MLNNKYHILPVLFQIQHISFVTCHIYCVQVATEVVMSHSRVTCLWFAHFQVVQGAQHVSLVCHKHRFPLLAKLFKVPSMCRNFDFYLEI